MVQITERDNLKLLNRQSTGSSERFIIRPQNLLCLGVLFFRNHYS